MNKHLHIFFKTIMTGPEGIGVIFFNLISDNYIVDETLNIYEKTTHQRLKLLGLIMAIDLAIEKHIEYENITIYIDQDNALNKTGDNQDLRNEITNLIKNNQTIIFASTDGLKDELYTWNNETRKCLKRNLSHDVTFEKMKSN